MGMGRGAQRYWLIVSTWLILSFCSGVTGASANDDFIAGSTATMLEHEFGVTDAKIVIQDGTVVVTTRTLGRVDRGKVISAIKQIPGVMQVDIREGDPAAAPAAPGAVQTTIPPAKSKWLPRGLLFSPLHADPRWAHFGAAFRQFQKGLSLSGVFAANFGESFSFYRNKAPFGGEWDFGIQAGVFSIFDVGSKSIDLINADYRVGAVSSYRNGRFSAFARLGHQSSHLGDEFLLNHPGITRVNLSYEELDAKLSYEFFSWLRVYGGGGYIVHRQPADLGRGSVQWGLELTSPRTYWGGRIRPVAYADFQSNERMNWVINRSVMAGVQFENARFGDRQVQLLAEYYAGRAPDGQFYTQEFSWYGIGVHLYF